jgi:formylglycine-generating enzyme required for sulfatase activity
MSKQVNDSNPVPVEPVAFRPPPPRRGFRRPLYRWLITGVLAAVLAVSGAAAWFVFTARQVTLRIEPAPEHLAIRGGLPAVRVGDYTLLRPGSYVIEARRRCFQVLKEKLTVGPEKRQKAAFRMQPLPGHVRFDIRSADGSPVPAQAIEVFIDRRKLIVPPGGELALQPGRRQVEIHSQDYLPLTAELDVEGCDHRQTLRLALKPDRARVRIGSSPSGAMVTIDGRSAGQTPLITSLKSGRHALKIHAPGFQTWRTDLEVVAGKPVDMAAIKLQPAPARVHLSSEPPGANVLVGKRFAGSTPVVLSLEPGKEHTIRLSRAGYEKAVRRLKLARGEEKRLRVKLTARMGIVELAVTPADAELVVDGKSRGKAAGKINLAAGSHQLEIRKKGYLPFQTTITARPGYPRKVEASLKKRGRIPLIAAANGYKLKLMQPTGTFTMGSSRREQGRLSNETLRKIRLKRPFYMGLREVTNGEFKKFKAAHRSGIFGGKSLDGDQLPVAQVSWREAALYCNWLSLKDSLEPVYVLQGDRLVTRSPVGTGYRLPCEAEWAWCARRNAAADGTRYPWGKHFPPPRVTANYADESGRQLLATYIPGYNDGYPTAAPVGSFAAGRAGLFDMAGNVSEWCHDVYSIYPYRPEQVDTDPMGPAGGRLHVIRGSSWQQGTITTLRLAYRYYGRNPRPDLGFRIARYAE